MSSAEYSLKSGSGIAEGSSRRDQPAERLPLAVVRCGRGQQHRVGAAGQQPGQAVAQVAFRHAGPGHVVGLVDHHAVPPRVLQEMAIAADVLQRIDADDDAVVHLERVLVRRNPQTQFGDPVRIQSDQWDAEAVPQFRLELGQHGLLGEHQNPVRPAASHEFREGHAYLDRLAQADGIRQQQSGPQLLERHATVWIWNFMGLNAPMFSRSGSTPVAGICRS